MKTCTKCGIEKELSEFHKDKQKKDGLCSACKECVKVRQKRWYNENYDEILGKVNKWKSENREKARENNRNSYHRCADKVAEYKRQYFLDNPKKRQAQSKVNFAVLKGDLPHVSAEVCADCGVQANERHHEDYTKPLDVIPLCHICHQKRHRTPV